MRIAAVGAAFPPHYYDQETLLAAFRAAWGERYFNLDRLERLHKNVLVGGRHLALPIDEYDALTTFGAANDAWIRVAEEVGERAVADALARAGLAATDLDAIFFVTVTGIATPSIDARLINRLGLSERIKRMPIFGLGCVAGAAGIARAADYVRAFPDEVGGPAVGRALLAHAAARRPVDPQPDRLGTVRRRRRGGDRRRRRARDGGRGRPGDRRHALGLLPALGAGDGLGHLAGGLQDRALGRGARGGRALPRARRRRLSRRPGPDARGHRLLGLPSGRPEGARGDGGGAGAAARGARAHLEEPRGSRQPLVDVGAARPARHARERRPPAGSYGMLLAMGPGFCSELVLLRW